MSRLKPLDFKDHKDGYLYAEALNGVFEIHESCNFPGNYLVWFAFGDRIKQLSGIREINLSIDDCKQIATNYRNNVVWNEFEDGDQAEKVE